MVCVRDVDDCGSDYAPLERSSWMFVFGADGRLGVAIDHSYGEYLFFCDSSAESFEDDFEYSLSDNSSLNLASIH